MSVSVCPHLQNYESDLHQFFLCLLPVAMARSDMLRISGLVDDRHICTS